MITTIIAIYLILAIVFLTAIRYSHADDIKYKIGNFITVCLGWLFIIPFVVAVYWFDNWEHPLNNPKP